jgi:hypothetical protein
MPSGEPGCIPRNSSRACTSQTSGVWSSPWPGLSVAGTGKLVSTGPAGLGNSTGLAVIVSGGGLGDGFITWKMYTPDA